MATSPPISPTVATPLAHRKRRHSEMTGSNIDVSGADHEIISSAKQTANGTHVVSSSNGGVEERTLEDENADEGSSSIEDFVDTAELEPYQTRWYD